MKRSLALLPLCLAGLAVLGCQKKEEAAPAVESSAYADAVSPQAAKEMSEAPAVPSTMAPSVGSAAAADRKFVRSAEMRFRCRSVVQATTAIERIVADAGGYVARNDLQVRSIEVHEEPYADDSLRRVERVDIVNDLVLQVPNDRLDSVLARLSPLVAALDRRVVTAQDVGQELRRADRERRRQERASQRLENLVDERAGKVRDLSSVLDNASDRADRADAALAREEDLLAQVALSSVSVSIYQHPETRLDTLAQPLYQVWRESLWSRFGAAAREGWDGFVEFVLWFVSHWTLVLVLAGIVYGFVRLRRSRPE